MVLTSAFDAADEGVLLVSRLGLGNAGLVGARIYGAVVLPLSAATRREFFETQHGEQHGALGCVAKQSGVPNSGSLVKLPKANRGALQAMTEEALDGERTSLLPKRTARWHRANVASALAMFAVVCVALAYVGDQGKQERIETIACCSHTDDSCCHEGPQPWFPGAKVVNIDPKCEYNFDFSLPTTGLIVYTAVTLHKGVSGMVFAVRSQSPVSIGNVKNYQNMSKRWC